MNYRIHALPIWEQGKYRENQEDAIYPALGMVSDDDRLFMVCDGMGGHEAGEVASNAVIEAMSQHLRQAVQPDGLLTDQQLQQALTAAYDLLDERDPNPESIKRMGTTMTLLQLHAGGATVAHIGDSRIYQFRPVDGQMTVVFRSVDHSLVNDLIKVGELTEEEARTSPLKNRLTRAMQSHLDGRPKADIRHLTDIRPGDYFYLCSDGMLENADDDNLCFMLGRPVSDEEKISMLKGNSEDNRDNHSAMLVHILEVTGTPVANPAPPTPHPAPPTPNPAPHSSGWWKWAVLVGVALLVILGRQHFRPAKQQAQPAPPAANQTKTVTPPPANPQPATSAPATPTITAQEAAQAAQTVQGPQPATPEPPAPTADSGEPEEEPEEEAEATSSESAAESAVQQIMNKPQPTE